jgi:hypothetical protein
MTWQMIHAKRKDYDGFLYVYVHSTRTPKTSLYIHFTDREVNARKPNHPIPFDWTTLRVVAQIYEQKETFTAAKLESTYQRVWERTDSQRSDLLQAKKWADEKLFTPMSHLVNGLTGQQ